MALNDNFSKNLRKIRKTLGYTQGEFAALIGTTKTTVFRYEKGGVSPSLSILTVLAQKFNVNLTWLINGTDDMGDMFVGAGANGGKLLLSDVFPDIPMDENVISLIESLEVPIMRNALIVKFIEYKKRYQEHIEEYFEKKKESSDTSPS